MQNFLYTAVSWLVREAILKFAVLGAVFFLIVELIPVILHYVGGFIDPASLNSAFTSLPSGIWWLLDYAQLGYGLPRVLAAAVAVFVIRRLPFVG